MSRRAMNGANQPMPTRLAADTNALHRCGIALCSHPAVSEGVCSMHLSRSSSNNVVNSRSAVPSLAHGGYASSATASDGSETPDRFYRSGAHMAMQPRAGPASKKQRTAAAAPPTMNAAPSSSMYSSSSGNSMELTQASLNQMNHNHNRQFGHASGSFSRNGNGSGMPRFDVDGSILSHDHHSSSLRPSGSTNDSVHSDGSENSLDADKETHQRRERNRIAARKSRQRKLDRISNLEDEKMRLEQHRDMLVQEIRSLEKRDAGAAGSATSAVVAIPDTEYARLQHERVQIIKAVEDAYNTGDICSTLQYFRADSIVSGPQNSSVHLRGYDALVLDFLCTTYLFSDIHLRHVKVDSGGPRSQHFRVHWTFSGCVKSAGVSMNKEFLELIDSVKGKRVTIEGVSNFSFSGDKIVYVHRTADQAKFLSALVHLSKQ